MTTRTDTTASDTATVAATAADTADTPTTPPLDIRGDHIPFARLVDVELRKMVDTRAGLWMLVVMAAISVLVCAVLVIWGTPADQTFATYLGMIFIPLTVLLPVLGIMSATQEWSHRTGLATFTLVPRRGRVLTAKAVAALALTLGLLVVAAAASAVATAISGGTFSLTGLSLVGVVLTALLLTLQGVAFGAALLNTPLAIVGILGGILQAVLLVGRQAMLVVVVTVAPIAGAFGGTQAGRSAFSKLISWTVALMLWKPVAALVYWIAFAMAGHDVKTAKDAQMAFYGFILISLTAFVMPMLIKLVTGGAAMAAGSGLSAAMTTAGVVAAAGTIAATGGAGAAGAGAGAGSAGVGASTSTAGSAGAGPGFSGGGAPSGGGSPSTGGGTGGSSGGGPSGGGSPSTGGGTGGPSGGGPHGGSGSDGAGAIPAGGGQGSSDDGGGASSLPSSGGGTGGGFDPGMAMQGLQTVSAATDSFFNDESYGAAEGGDVR